MIRFRHDGETVIVTADERGEHRLDVDQLLELISALSSRSDYELTVTREEAERPNPIVMQSRSTQPVSVVSTEQIEQYRETRRREEAEARERATARQQYEGIDIIDSAALWAMRRNYSNEELRDVVQYPDQEWKSHHGEAHIKVSGRVGAVVADDTQSILVIFPSDELAERFPYTQYQSTGRSQRPKGGKGTGYPSGMKDLVRRAQASGLHCEMTNSGHWRISNEAGKYVTASSSPSDRHAIRNAARDIHKWLGVDLEG